MQRNAAQLICAFVYAYTKSKFSHDAAQMTAEKYKKYTIIKLSRNIQTNPIQILSSDVPSKLEKIYKLVRCASSEKPSVNQYYT